MNSRKVVIIMVFLVVGIIGASLLIKPKNESEYNKKSKKDSQEEYTEKDEAGEIKEALDKVYDIVNMSNVIEGEIFKEGFRKGINMGNMLEAPAEGDWGVTFDPEYFRLIKEKGFDFVRIPIRWSAHCDLEIISRFSLPDFNNGVAYGGIIDEDFVARVDYIVDCALKNGLGVVINVHNFDELMSADLQKETEYEIHPMFALYNIWSFLAYHYQSMPDNVLFEILNEPNGNLSTELWNYCQLHIYSIIREMNPKRGIIFQAGAYGGYTELDQLYLPRNDKNVAVSFHFYDPFSFTHQGADWPDGMDQYLGTRWTNDDLERKRIDVVFNNLKALSEAAGLPVFLGEFGAYEKADMESRIMWTKYVRETAEKYGFSWCYWEFYSGFGIFDGESMTFQENLTAALLDGKKSDFNTGKGNVKVTYSTAGIDDLIYTSSFTYNRKMNIKCDSWTNMLLYDTNTNTQIVNIKGASDWGVVTLPLEIKDIQLNGYGSDIAFSKNTIELTLRNISNSVTDLRIALCRGNREVTLYDNPRFDEEAAGIYDNKTTITLKLNDFAESFNGSKDIGQALYLKIFIETVPDRKDNYDRNGSIEFLEMQVY